MGQLAYDLQLPADHGDWMEDFDLLIHDVAKAIMSSDFATVDKAVTHTQYDLANSDYELSGVDFFEYLTDVLKDRRMAIDVLAGANLRLHALECATDYVEYLLGE